MPCGIFPDSDEDSEWFSKISIFYLGDLAKTIWQSSMLFFLFTINLRIFLHWETAMWAHKCFIADLQRALRTYYKHKITFLPYIV